MVIDASLLDYLSRKAKESPRLRMNYDLRTSAGDGSQRMLNALEPGTYLPVHRHRDTSETVVMVRGSVEERFYDEEGRMTESVVLKAGSVPCALQIEKGRWHDLVCLESGTVLFEAKDGKFIPRSLEDEKQI